MHHLAHLDVAVGARDCEAAVVGIFEKSGELLKLALIELAGNALRRGCGCQLDGGR